MYFVTTVNLVVYLSLAFLSQNSTLDAALARVIQASVHPFELFLLQT